MGKQNSSGEDEEMKQKMKEMMSRFKVQKVTVSSTNTSTYTTNAPASSFLEFDVQKPEQNSQSHKNSSDSFEPEICTPYLFVHFKPVEPTEKKSKHSNEKRKNSLEKQQVQESSSSSQQRKNQSSQSQSQQKIHNEVPIQENANQRSNSLNEQPQRRMMQSQSTMQFNNNMDQSTRSSQAAAASAIYNTMPQYPQINQMNPQFNQMNYWPSPNQPMQGPSIQQPLLQQEISNNPAHENVSSFAGMNNPQSSSQGSFLPGIRQIFGEEFCLQHGIKLGLHD